MPTPLTGVGAGTGSPQTGQASFDAALRDAKAAQAGNGNPWANGQVSKAAVSVAASIFNQVLDTLKKVGED